MRNTIYKQLIFCINSFRTWIEIVEDSHYKEMIISRRDRTDYVVSRVLVLRAFKENAPYSIGDTWTISEHDLDRALAIYRHDDSSFKARIKKGGGHLTAQDTETIIRLATYGIVHLNLVVRPIYQPLSSYCL